MASIILSVRKNVSFSASTAAASGVVVRGTYTVPAGKRARLVLCCGEIVTNTAAAGTLVSCFVSITTNAIARVFRLSGVAAVQLTTKETPMTIELAAGDSVTISTENSSAVAIVMTITAWFEEFG